MKISTRARYGLRMMVRLAINFGNGPMDIRQISEVEGISLKYLGLIAISLKAAGLIRTARGFKGGSVLSKEPDNYTLLEIIEAIEGRISLIDCVANPKSCARESECLTKTIWAELNETIRNKLSEKTLRDLIRECGDMREYSI
jgi:Rrf2 family cysteine metabolism transcriptional repressor